MDLSGPCWDCPESLPSITFAVLIALAVLVLGRLLVATKGRFGRGLGQGLSVTGLILGLVALHAILRYGIAWPAGWSHLAERSWFPASPEEAARFELYDRVFAIAWLVAIIVAWVAVPRIVASTRAEERP